MEEEKKHAMEDEKYQPNERFKIHVGIDFGTDGSGLAYAVPDDNGRATVYIHNLWKDVVATQKPKTSILFDNTGRVQGRGNPAVGQYINAMHNEGWKLFERFKMSLYEYSPSWISDITTVKASRKDKTVELKETIQTTSGNAEELSEVVFVACLKWLKSEAMKFIRHLERRHKKKNLIIQDDEIKWILTVPAIWSETAKQKMKDWAIKAELIKPEHDKSHIPTQFKIVYEPDCASLSIQHAVLRNVESQKDEYIVIDNEDETENKQQSKKPKSRKKIKGNKRNQLSVHRPQISINAKFKKGDKYILLDVGGGTCDVACHQVIGEFAIAEILHPSGGPWGACNIDKEFELMLDDIFSKEWMDEFKTNNPGMYQQQLQNFISQSKTTFYDGMKVNNKDYHSITMVRNFVDHLLGKFEDEENAEEYTLDDDDDDDDDDDYFDIDEEETALDIFLKKKCKELYKNEDVIKIEEFNGCFALSMHIKIWKMLFDTIIDHIIGHCDKILESQVIDKCEYIFLVGGFANSLYFQERIKQSFNRINVVIPELPQLCVVDGAARYGLKPHFMKIRRLSKSYGIKASKPRSNIKDESIFPDGYIENNLIKNDKNDEKEEHIKDCFMIFATKNKAININDNPIKRSAVKQHPKQTMASIELYESDKDNPATCHQNEATKRGEFEIHFKQNINRIWIEFNYSDTMLTVHAYPDGSKKNTQNKVQVHYV